MEALNTIELPTLQHTHTGSKFTEALLPSTTLSSSSTVPPFLTLTRTSSPTLTITPFPRLRRRFGYRNPHAATAAVYTPALGRYRSDDGIAVYEGGCAAGTLTTGESGEICLVDVYLRARRVLKDDESRRGSRGKRGDMTDEMKEGLAEGDWRSLALVLAQVAGPLVDWRFVTFYRGYMERRGEQRSRKRSYWGSAYFDPDMLLQDVQGVLDQLRWGRIASRLEREMKRWREWNDWGCGWVTARSLKGAKVLRAVRKASRECGVSEGQLGRAIEAYAFYALSSSSREEVAVQARRGGTLTADGLTEEGEWKMLAEILVEDLEDLSEQESHKNAARLMRRRMRSAVRGCRDVYFEKCTMVFSGRVDWSLSPKSRGKVAKEAEARQLGGEEEEEERQRESGVSGTGTLLAPKRLSEATTAVADSLKRHSRKLGFRISELLRRSLDSDEEEERVDKEIQRELPRPPCQEAQHYPIFDPDNPSHLPSRPVPS